MRIGILQTGDTPEELKGQFGEYGDMFIRLLGEHDHQFEFTLYPVSNSLFPDSPEECDGWLITGSRFSAYEDQAWIHTLKALIREISETERPLIGVCFGHQLIAEALGGRVEKSHKGWGLGLDTYSLTADTPGTDAQNITLNIFHQDQIVELPPGARVFASSEFCEYAGLIIGDRIMTIQAHPEFQNDYNSQLLQARRASVVPEDQADEAIDRLRHRDAQADSKRFARLMGDFLLNLNKPGTSPGG